MNTELSNVEDTAATIVDLVQTITVPYGDEIIKAVRVERPIKSFCPELSFLVASRHLTTKRILSTLEKAYQIIEMGAGFSTHGLANEERFSNWIEIDLPSNSGLKRRISTQIKPSNRVQYISGDIFSHDTWKIVSEITDTNQPMFIFCEGVVSHYASEEEKDTLARHLYPLLVHPKSKLFIDDTLKNHPEIDDEPIIFQAKAKLSEELKNTKYTSQVRQTVMDEKLRWFNRGFNVSLVPYVSTNPEFSKVVDCFKGYLCSRRRQR